MNEAGVELAPLAEAIERLQGQGQTVVHLARDGQLVGLIAIADAPRPSSAAGVFYPLVISPEVAALAMSGSSALVAVNALLLKRLRLDHREAAAA